MYERMVVKKTEYEIIDASTVFGFWPFRKIDISLQKLLSEAKKHRISKVCSLSCKGIFYDFKAGNEETWQAAQKHSEIIPVGTINPGKLIGFEEEMLTRVEQGFRLFRFFSEHQPWWKVTALSFKKVLALLNELKLPFMIYARDGAGVIAEATKAFNAPVILEAVHHYDSAEVLTVAEDCPNIFVETHWLNGPDTVKTFVDKIGAGRLIFGSNAPLFSIQPAINLIRYAKIKEDEKQAIFSQNIKRLLSGEWK